MASVDPRHAWMRNSAGGLRLQLLLKAPAKHIGSLVRMKTAIRPATLDFMAISQEEINHSVLLFEAQRLSDRLEPYANNNTMFRSSLKRCVVDGRNLAIFGRVLDGLFFVDLTDGSAGLLPIDCETTRQYCNSDLESFAAFHVAFMEAIQPAMKTNSGVTERVLMELEAAFRKRDASSMADESSFWSMRLYELSEGFFPLSSEKVELHRSLGIDLCHPW